MPLPRIERVHLADKEELAAVHSLNGEADQLLGCAVTVHFGGIDQVHPRLHTGAQRLVFFREQTRVLPQIPCSLTDGADRLAALRRKNHCIEPPVPAVGLIVARSTRAGKLPRSLR